MCTKLEIYVLIDKKNIDKNVIKFEKQRHCLPTDIVSVTNDMVTWHWNMKFAILTIVTSVVKYRTNWGAVVIVL
jgi:hypothetical protein